MPVRVDCTCGQAFAADDELIGHQVRCPSCSGPLIVRAAVVPAAPEPVAAAATINVICQCGQQLSAPQNLWGLRVPCPRCQAPVYVPAAPATQTPTIQPTADAIQPPAAHGVPQAATEIPQLENEWPDFGGSEAAVQNDDQSTWTLSDSARASNPGRLNINRLKWFMSYPLWPVIWGLPLLLLLVLGFLHWSAWILAGAMFLLNWFYWTRVREHFRHGCANPGIVVALNPMLIAVYTDLTKGWGEFPTIRIIQKELASVCGQTPQIGAHVATVALYGQMSDDLPHWDEFDPRPVDCATSDVNRIRDMLNTFDADDWQQLQQGLQFVPKPYQPGQYFLRQLGSWFELT